VSIPASTAEKQRLVANLLLQHGVLVLSWRDQSPPTVGGPLGGARGVHVTVIDRTRGTVDVRAFHPSKRERRRLLKAALQTLQGQGWTVSLTKWRSPWDDGRWEPLGVAVPGGRHPYGDWS
jgi:hypothetical protein